MVVSIRLLRLHHHGPSQLRHAGIVGTQDDAMNVPVRRRLPRQQHDALALAPAPVLTEHVRVLQRRQDDVLERIQLLPHGAALAVHRHDRVARAQRPHARDVGHDDAVARRLHTAKLAESIEDAGATQDSVGLRRAELRTDEELIRRLVEMLAVGAVVRLRYVMSRAPAAVRRHGAAMSGRDAALVLDVVRVPLEQRRHVDDLQRDGVRPLLVVPNARVMTSTLAHVQLHPGHLLLRRHRHEQVPVREAAMSLHVPHGVFRVDSHPAVVVGDVQLLYVRGRVERVRDSVETVVVEHSAVVVFARDLGHQLVEESVVLPSVHPLVGVERVEGETCGPCPRVLLQRFPVHHPGHQVVDDPEAVHGQVTLEWMTQDAVVPLGDLRVGAVDHVHDGGRQVAKVLQAAFPSCV